MKWRCIAEDSELFRKCGLHCGSGQIPCESSERKSRGEYFDHLSSYKNDQKAEWGTSKDDEVEGTVNPSLQNPHNSNRKTS